MAARIPLPDEFAGRPFAVSEALADGIGRSRLAGPDLQRPFWGIRVSGAADDDVEALCRALSLRMPPGAFFTHATAAQLMRLPLPRRLELMPPLHVGVAVPARAMDARGVVGHRLRVTPAELAAWGGLRHTGPARTWLDLASALSLVELVAVGDHIVHRAHPLATVQQLTDALGRYPSRRGLVRARVALPLLRIGAESPRESALRVIIVLAGLPEPECNVNIFDSDGRFLARGDLVYPEFRLVLEYQGDHHRTDRAQWRRDIRRVQSVEDNDWQMLQFTDDDLRNPAELVARIERRLRARGWAGTRHPRR
ncbi:hypothetical protein QMG61_01310 [Cryobacterium sp. PH31-AA6]|uniref:hypothetical protein n=1 Tax=Cryobacterium sp. PH31-AA6 TaxID=3046205 RepID=UPI0024B8A8F9|nr:hypothetical protein [Cryobacterium sp. PH31-AA6]MDJ0322402.1 hypothetical protein [Cryobacterium sp. PH31-AA6]